MSFTTPFSFGSPAPSAFGATTPQPSAFGGSTFGGTSTTGFGTTGGTSFGTTQQSTFPSTSFGGTTGTTGGFGFGQPTTGASTFGSTTPSTTGFGFGSTASPSPFGATTQQPASSSVFGSTTQSPFGAPTTGTTGGSMFGSTTPANPFGATPSTTTFGATTPSTTGTSFGFGGTSSFGTTGTTTTSAFGAPATQSAFGSTPAFGAPSTGFAGNQTGTAVAKYAETAINENNQMVKFLTITAMEQYKNKSNEELRWEDYQRIKSGGGQFGTAATGATTTFGATTPSTGFGGFGTTTTAAPATSFSFGSSAPTTSAFGTTPTTQPSTTFGTSFGTTPSATTGTSPFSFGGSTGTTGTSLGGTTFGATTGTSGTSPFSFGGTTGTTGATSTPSAFSFGGTSSTPATSQPSAFSFGGTTGASTSQPAAGTSPFSFGGTTGTSGSAPSTFSFGGTTGTSQPSGSSPFSFGGTTSTPSTGSSTFSFGNTGSSTGANMFGTGQTGGTTPGFGTSSFSFGGTSTPSTTGSSNLFGFGGTPGTTTPSTGSGMFNFGGSTGTPQTGATSSSLFGSTGFGAQTTTQANVQIPMPSINSTPFGPPPLVIPNPGNVNTSTTATTQPPMTPVGAVKTARIAVTPHYKMTPRSATKLKPRGFTGKLLTPESEVSSSMEAREADHLFVPRQSIKKLDIESSTVDESPLFNREKRAQLISGVAKPEDSVAGRRVEDASRSIDSLATPQRTPRLPDTPFVTSTPSNQARGRPSIDLEQSNLNFSVDSGVQSSTPARATSEGTPVKASDLPKISKPGYYSSPSLAEMRASTVEALRAVKDFTVGCEGVGSVRFLGETDVRKLAVDDLVIFHNKEIEVYPDESKKPPVGHELNKPAVLTLQKCFPKDKSGKRLTAPEDISRFENKLKHQTQKFGGRFISYKADAGEWSFRVEHFSRYGLDEDDEDDDEEKAKQPQKPLAPLPANAKQAPLPANAKQAPQTNKPLVKPQPVRATAPPQTASSDDVSMNGSEEDYEEEQQLRDARYRNEEYEEDEEEEEFDSQEEMQDEYDEEEEEYDEYENYQAQPARMRYESTSSQDLGSDDVEQEPEYVSPTRRTTGQMVPEQLGLNPAKIQVMKSLLFQDETPQGNASKRRRMDREGPSPAAFTPSRVERPQREITPVFQVMKEQSPVAPAKAASIVVTKQRAERVAIPLAKSVVNQHTDGLKDAGLFMSRSFRVGWGPGGVLFRLAPTKRPAAAEPSNFSRSSVIETAVGKENPPTFSTIVMERINPVPELGTVDHARQFYLPFLENHLNKTSPEQQPHSDIPQLRIGENFDDFVTSTILTLEQLKSNQLPTGQVGFDIPSLNLDHCISVWKLIKALWGKHSLDVPFELEEDARRHYLSMWLKDAVIPTVKEELNAILKNKSPFANEESNNAVRLRAIFSSLTGKKVKEAVDLAIENKDYRFAMLLAQAANNEEFNNAVRDQLAQWRKSGADKTIEHERMALYKLLAAEVDSVSGSLDWKRAFGLQLWYGQPSTSSIGQVVSAFEHAVVKGHARKPLPIYKPYKDYKPQKVEGSLKFTENFDTNFHVLRLYSDRNHPWHQAMHPLNNSHNIQDYWMSWNLFSALSALNLFGNSTHNGRDYVFELGMSFASQLEMCGLWEWAIYVIYNLPETYPNIRERAVRAILSRYVTDIETLDQEQFLRQRLNLPVEWIEEAKSWRAMSRGKLNDAVWHMINSRQYESAHHLIVTALASKYILNEAYNEELFNMLDTLGRHVNHLIDWENRGGMYYDYLGVEKEFKHCQETLRHTEDSAAIAEVVARLSSLEQFVASLSKRLAVWVAEDNNELAKKGNNGGKPSRRRDWLSNDLFDRVCLAEMSTRLSQYGVAVKQLLTDNQPHADLNLMTDVNHFTAELSANGLAVAHRLKELAIPEDYRLTQLNDLCANFLSSLQQVA